MAGSLGSKEKKYANRGARRGSIVVSQNGTQKKSKKDTDTESVSSEGSTVVPPPLPKPTCPLRPYMEIMFETEEGEAKNKRLCPLRTVKLSHTIPLCIFILLNMWIVIVALLVTGGFRLTGIILDWKDAKLQEGNAQSLRSRPIFNSNATGFMFVGMAVFAFFVTTCYGPEWMRTTFQIIITIGSFTGLSMALVTKPDTATIFQPVLATPTTPAPDVDA